MSGFERLNINVGTKEDVVIIDLGQPIQQLSMSAGDARAFGSYIMQRAREAAGPHDFRRASGDVVCDVCGDTYYHHPSDKKDLGYDGHPFLRILCNGERVKL